MLSEQCVTPYVHKPLSVTLVPEILRAAIADDNLNVSYYDKGHQLVFRVLKHVKAHILGESQVTKEVEVRVIQ